MKKKQESTQEIKKPFGVKSSTVLSKTDSNHPRRSKESLGIKKLVQQTDTEPFKIYIDLPFRTQNEDMEIKLSQSDLKKKNTDSISSGINENKTDVEPYKPKNMYNKPDAWDKEISVEEIHTESLDNQIVIVSPENNVLSSLNESMSNLTPKEILENSDNRTVEENQLFITIEENVELTTAIKFENPEEETLDFNIYEDPEGTTDKPTDVPTLKTSPGKDYTRLDNQENKPPEGLSLPRQSSSDNIETQRVLRPLYPSSISFDDSGSIC